MRASVADTLQSVEINPVKLRQSNQWASFLERLTRGGSFMVRPRRITSIALSTLAVVGGFATALPAQASASVAIAQTQQLVPTEITVGGAISTSGLFDGYVYLSTNDAMGSNAKYTVDYGDGTKDTQSGGPVPTSQAPLRLSHQFTGAEYGSHTITVTVDEGSGAAPVSKTYDAVWHYPTAPTEPSLTVAQTGGNAPFNLTATISGGTVDPAATKSYVINWGDGSPVQTIAAPASGSLTVNHLYTKSSLYVITTTPRTASTSRISVLARLPPRWWRHTA